MTEFILADGISYSTRGLQQMLLLDADSGHHVEFQRHEKRAGKLADSSDPLTEAKERIGPILKWLTEFEAELQRGRDDAEDDAA